LPITGTWRDIYFSGATLAGGDRTFHSQLDFKLIPYTGGALLIPLRELSPPPQHVDPGPAVALRAHALGQAATQGIEFGLPCMILPRRASCASLATVPQ